MTKANFDVRSGNVGVVYTINVLSGLARAAYFDSDTAVKVEVSLFGIFNLISGVGLAWEKAFAERADVGY